MARRRPSHESRVYRPFVVDRQLESLFDDSCLLIGKERCKANETVSLDSVPFRDASIDIQWARSNEAFSAFKSALRHGMFGTGIVPEHACLAVTARTPYLKGVRQLVTFNAGNLTKLRRLTNLGTRGDRPDVLRAAFHGFEVIVSLTLNKDLPKDDLRRPRDKGFWLARATFTIKSLRHAPLWHPKKLTKEHRETLNLAPQAVTYVEFGDDADVLAPLEEAAPVLWIDEDVWDLLARPSNKENAEALARHYFLQVVSETLYRYAAHTSDSAVPLSEGATKQILRDSVIGRFVSAIAGRDASVESRQQLLHLAGEDPALVQAMAQDSFDLKRSILTAWPEP